MVVLEELDFKKGMKRNLKEVKMMVMMEVEIGVMFGHIYYINIITFLYTFYNKYCK